MTNTNKDPLITSKPEVDLKCSHSSFRYGFEKAVTRIRAEFHINDLISIASTIGSIFQILSRKPAESNQGLLILWVVMFVVAFISLVDRLKKFRHFKQNLNVAFEEHMTKFLRDIHEYDPKAFLEKAMGPKQKGSDEPEKIAPVLPISGGPKLDNGNVNGQTGSVTEKESAAPMRMAN